MTAVLNSGARCAMVLVPLLVCNFQNIKVIMFYFPTLLHPMKLVVCHRLPCSTACLNCARPPSSSFTDAASEWQRMSNLSPFVTPYLHSICYTTPASLSQPKFLSEPKPKHSTHSSWHPLPLEGPCPDTQTHTIVTGNGTGSARLTRDMCKG